MYFRYLSLLFLTGFMVGLSQAQSYISTCETVPFACPSLCQGGTLTVKVFQVLRLPSGSHVQGELSDVNGNFGSGSLILEAAQYSTNGNTYQAGPYLFNGDASNLFLRFAIPASVPAGSNYKLRIRSSSGYASADNFRCPNNGNISIAPGGAALPPVPQTTAGNGRWIGHIYSWAPTTANPLTTDPQVAQQDFFNPNNYQGHTVYAPLNLDLSFSTTGGVPGASADSSSFTCSGNSFQTNFSMRLRRRETFAPGFYAFSIAGDDGIRFSLDGGVTWVLSSWYDQLYSASTKTTNTAYPNGICLAGPVDMVIEYFQHPADARLTFTATRVSPVLAQPRSQGVCEGGSPVSFSYGYAAPGNQYQWQASTDGGQTYVNLAETAPYSGTQTQNLTVTNPASTLSGMLYRCLLTNSCLTGLPSDTARLTVRARARLSDQPQSQSACPGTTAVFSVQATGQTGYQWQVDKGSGFVNATDPAFSGAQTGQLAVAVQAVMDGWRFRCMVEGSCGTDQSDPARLTLLKEPEIDRQPADQEICAGGGARFVVVSPLRNAQYAWQVSTNGGQDWVSLNNTAPYSGTGDSALTVSYFPGEGESLLYRAIVRAECGTDAVSRQASLKKCCVLPELPNVITANGDGVNDEFGSIACSVGGFSMQIFNRWGNKIYVSSESVKGWDGGGQPAAVYFYRLAYTLNGQAVEKRGWVELVR